MSARCVRQDDSQRLWDTQASRVYSLGTSQKAPTGLSAIPACQAQSLLVEQAPVVKFVPRGSLTTICTAHALHVQEVNTNQKLAKQSASHARALTTPPGTAVPWETLAAGTPTIVRATAGTVLSGWNACAVAMVTRRAWTVRAVLMTGLSWFNEATSRLKTSQSTTAGATRIDVPAACLEALALYVA
mmetsp:Transcript_5838/g.12795  ORF Transcript_5838/g.12795 Transcript_5838/m.12795 type:complete len:187 (+) Transcript_5838:107-667(+)